MKFRSIKVNTVDHPKGNVHRLVSWPVINFHRTRVHGTMNEISQAKRFFLESGEICNELVNTTFCLVTEITADLLLRPQ